MNSVTEAVDFDSSQRRDFQRALKSRVRAYLATQPAGRKATGFMWFKVVFYLCAWWGTWAQVALVQHSLPVDLALIVALSTLTMATAYNVSHDAVHGTISERPWVNELLFQLTFNIFGPNAYLWRLRHAVMHHMCVNIPGLDFNIEASDILRFSPTQKWRPMHRYQHLYAPFAYLVFTMHWIWVKDFQMLRLSRIGNVAQIEHTPRRVLEIVFWKLVHVVLMFVLPVMVGGYSIGTVLAGYVIWQALGSFQFVLTFTGSHLNRGLVFVERDDAGRVPHSFYEHQLHTSMDFHPESGVLTFLIGGFNAHIAHHMFPHICSVHYPKLTPIIRRTALEFGLPYRQTTLARLFVDHFRYLAELGIDPDSPRAAYLHKAV